MSTLTEIKSAALALPARDQAALLRFLTRRAKVGTGRKVPRPLKAAARPPLEGLPETLSTDTKTKVRARISRRHAPNC